MHPLNKYLKENKIKIQDFAREIGISRISLYYIFTYKSFPRRELAKKIEFLTNKQITVMDLLYPEGVKQDEVKNANQ